MATFKEALEYAKNNPTSSFAKELETGIKSGQYNDVAMKEGVDLSPIAKTTVPTQIQPGQQKSLMGSYYQTKVDLGKGAVKGALGTLQNVGNLIAQPINAGFNRLLGTNQQVGLSEKTLQPSNTTQKVGMAAEQIGEFFTPVGITSKAKVAIGASHIPEILKFVSKVGTQVLADTGVALAQGQSKENVKGTAIASGITEALPSGVKAIANTPYGKEVTKYLTERIPGRLLNSIIKPNEVAFNFGKNPGEAVIKEGVTAFTRGGLLTKIGETKQQIGSSIGKLIESPQIANKALNVYDAITTPLQKAKSEALASGEKALFSRLNDIEEGLTSIYTPNGKTLEVGGTRLLDNLTPKQVQDLKIKIGQATKWTGQAFDKEANQARVAIYRNLDDILDKAVPGIDKLNSKYANLLTAEKNLERTDKRMQRLVNLGLRTSGVGIGTGIASTLSGDSPLEATLKGAAASLGFEALGSTAVKTKVAQILKNLPEAERIALERVAPALKNIVLGSNSVND